MFFIAPYQIKVKGHRRQTFGTGLARPCSDPASLSLMLNATVSPITATTPITYVWQATQQSAAMHTGGGTSDGVSFTWATAGTKAITVTASNALGAVTGNHTIDISAVRYRIYLPLVMKH